MRQAARSAAFHRRAVGKLGGPATTREIRWGVAQREQVASLREAALSTFQPLDGWVSDLGKGVSLRNQIDAPR